MATARGFEAFLQYLILNGCGIIKPNPEENNVVTITSGLREFDRGFKGTETRDGRLHSVFISCATNIIGNENCRSKSTKHIRMKSIELNVSETTNKQKESGKQYLCQKIKAHPILGAQKKTKRPRREKKSTKRDSFEYN